jgi:hypothetical protein
MHLAPVRDVQRIRMPSVLLAIALTAVGFGAVLAVSPPTMFSRAITRVVDTTRRETLVFFEQPHVTVAVHPSPSLPATSRSIARGLRTPVNASDSRMTRTQPRDALRQPSRTSEIVGPSSTLLPRYHPPIRFTPSPFELPHARNPFLSEAPQTREEMDSILAVRRAEMPRLSMIYVPTVAVRDSLIKAQAQNNVVPGRAPQMMGNGIGGGIGFTFLSPGPSAAERRRDSAANAEYVGRLRRLQERVQSARESLRLADSMTRRRTP